MNRKKKEKSVLRKEGNVYVLDLFVEVPPSATTPIRYEPMEVDAIIQVADGREQRKTPCGSHRGNIPPALRQLRSLALLAGNAPFP